MNILNRDSFAYEMGVLLFNIQFLTGLKFTNQYDVVGNITTLWNSLENVDVSLVKNGFVAECQNNNINEEKAESLFKQVYSVLKDHDR